MIDDEEIVIPEGAVLHRRYTYHPYTYHRIVKILKDANLYLHPIIWYKCGRYAGYKQRYDIKEIGTDRIIRKNVYLDDLREIFARLDIPMKEPKIEQRNQKAEQFLEAVRNAQEKQELSNED